MEDQQPRARKLVEGWMLGKMQTKGLRPRFAAYLLAGIWLVAVVSFGIAEHVIDKDTFPTIWWGMWWALQTVTTVGYGDVVPADAAGKVLASGLLLVGLSFFAVVTGVITSAFVTQAQADRRAAGDDPVLRALDAVNQKLASTEAELARLRDEIESSRGR